MRGDSVKVEVTVCDVAPESEIGVPTQHYKLERGGRKVERDLCVQHAEGIEFLLQLGKSPNSAKPARKSTPASRGRARSRSLVTSFEDIERLKQS